MWYKSLGLVLVVVAQIGWIGTADASLLDIRIDFNDKQAAPTNWNLIADPADTSTVHDNLIDYYTGNSTGVALQFTDGIVKSGENQTTTSTWSNPAAPWVDTTALYDYGVAYSTNLTGRLVLSGLDAGKTYSVEVLSVRTGNAGSATRYEVNDVLDDTGNSAWDSYADGWINQGFLKWSEVTPINVANGEGEIVLELTAPSSTYAFLNGMRVAEVPEPSTWLSLLVGVVALGAWRWRKS